jgi:hypothetical protein
MVNRFSVKLFVILLKFDQDSIFQINTSGFRFTKVKTKRLTGSKSLCTTDEKVEFTLVHCVQTDDDIVILEEHVF